VFDFSAKEAVIIGVVFAVVQFGTAFVYGVTGAALDFSIFLRTTERFVEGQRMYSADLFDFTPPLFHALLLPLVHTDPRIAFVVWTFANVIVAWVLVMKVLRVVPNAWTSRWVIAAWIVNAAGVQMAIRLGQVSWLVAAAVTCAWMAARSSRWVATGIWTGVAIAFKPFLLLALPVFVVRRQWKALAISIATVVACCGLGVVIFGWLAFADWLGNLRATPDPAYATHFLNASWLGFVARLGAPSVVASVLSAATIAVMLWRVRSSDEDEAWFLLLVAATLASPVGWVYYQPLLLGPAVALAMSGRLTRLRIVALTCVVPALSKNLFQEPAVVAVTLGSIYFWGLLVTLVSMAFGSAVQVTTAPEPQVRTSQPV
jgi:hypothetical protein